MPRPVARCRVVSNTLKSKMNVFDKEVKRRLDLLAHDAAYDTSMDIKNRSWMSKGREFKVNLRPFNTRASENSIYYYYTNGESNYEDVANNFRVRAGHNYAGRSLEEVVFPEHTPLTEPGVFKAGFASLSLILAFWEYGHNNQLTGRYECTPTISWTAFQYWKKLQTAFVGIM